MAHSASDVILSSILLLGITNRTGTDWKNCSMATRATAITPELLVWARERAGLTQEEVARYISKKVMDVAAWESGSSWPTYRQLEKLAQGLYHRPVALFFLPEPPEESATNQEFRTLPDFDIEHLSADTRYAVRIGRAYQLSLKELTGGHNLYKKKIFTSLRLVHSSNVTNIAQQIRNYLNVSLDLQQSWTSTANAMAAWRSHIENAGVYVFKRSFKQREISGFCLTDDEFPIIMINNSTPFTRQIFTLFHELAHLLSGVSSLTTLDGRFVERMLKKQRSVEIICNRLAAEILLPKDIFPWSSIDRSNPILSACKIAEDFNVSREVVLRRLLDRGWVSSSMYEAFTHQWIQEAEKGRQHKGVGGDYYNTKTAYLGDSFLRLAFSRYHAGLVGVAELADHLGVKAKNISKLEYRVLERF